MREQLRYIQQLRQELKQAYRFQNHEAMWNITNRLLTVYANMADALLEEERNANPSYSVGPAVPTKVQVAEDTTMYFNCPHGLPRGN